MNTRLTRGLGSLFSGWRPAISARKRNGSGIGLDHCERKRLEKLPRLARTTTHVLGHNIQLTDPFWFLHTYHEIFEKEVYRFPCEIEAPYILDCGANIGLSVIYFKYLYPSARIVAFEPDPVVCQALAANTHSCGLESVLAIDKAVWTSETVVFFEPDGSVGGRIASADSSRSKIEVATVRLRDWLDSPVNLLKIDIEGAECDVLLDCEDRLDVVDRLFMEYHSKASEPQRLHETLALLERSGFRYHIQDANPIEHPFIKKERSTFYDLQLNVYAFRD